ncbi:MAG: hypothetical protein AAGE05_08500 [Pseudomonadota bacterium]
MTGLMVLIAMAFQTTPLPLPERTDIPEDYSTVICPDRAAAERMLADFYAVAPAPRNHTHIIPLFFEGLDATGCVQGGPLKVGTITIETVLMRRSFDKADGPGQVIAFQGVNAEGTPLVGIVDETGNNNFPRTPLERWLETYADGDILTVRPGIGYVPPTYICPSLMAANASVAAIPNYETEATTEQAATAAFETALAANGCSRTEGRYRITALGEDGVILCGYECAAHWTALEAETPDGRTIGLIYEASLM